MSNSSRNVTRCALLLLAACAEPEGDPRLAAAPASPTNGTTTASAHTDAGARTAWTDDLLAIVERAEREFGVPTVSVSGFDALPIGTLLFDVRSAAEVSVSGIPNARLLSDEYARQALLDAPPSGPLVVSCAAGWRSARFTQALREKGVEAYNLEGGIFAWVAAGRPIHDPTGRPAKRVHTYNEAWAKCLPADHEVVLEPAP